MDLEDRRKVQKMLCHAHQSSGRHNICIMLKTTAPHPEILFPLGSAGQLIFAW
jgi:hypothetical protein